MEIRCLVVTLDKSVITRNIIRHKISGGPDGYWPWPLAPGTAWLYLQWRHVHSDRVPSSGTGGHNFSWFIIV